MMFHFDYISLATNTKPIKSHHMEEPPLSQPIPLKIKYLDQIRRISISIDSNFQELRIAIFQILSLPQPEMNFYWKDSDGDDIQFSTDLEWNEAKYIYRSEKLSKLLILIQMGKSVKSRPRLSLPTREMKTSYDVVVIGSGYGGGISASRLSRAGQKV